MAIIVLDAGHGGTRNKDGSSWNNAKGPGGLLEKTVTLQVALAAEAALRGSGHTVAQTRTTDVNIGIDDRAAVARHQRAHAFVSIHFNAPGGTVPAQGTETWIGSGHTKISERLAAAVQKRVAAATGYRYRGVKVGPVSGVISPRRHDAQTANCLVEISFLSLQVDEEARLRTEAYIARLGSAVALGVRDSLAERGLDAAVEHGEVQEPECEDAAAAYLSGEWEDDAETTSGAELRPQRAGAIAERQSRRNIPFIVPKPTSDAPFQDLAGGAPVDAPAEMLKGWRTARETGFMVEKAVGRYVTISASLLQILADNRRAVAKIVAEGVDFEGMQSPPWSGTGFLVSENLLLTNHHVLNSVDVAKSASVEFDYEVSPRALLSGQSMIATSRRVFKVDPGRLFVTSPLDGGLDYTFVWIDRTAKAEFGQIAMERSSFTVGSNEQAFVIHHPDGRPKEASVDDTDIIGIDSKIVHYASDTEGGSSGAPVFDRQGRLIALHHASVRRDVQLPEGHTAKFINEGVKICAIAIDLEAKGQGNGAEGAMAREILAAMNGSDTLTGFFGGLGRRPQGQTDVERVINTYRGDDADIDVGFWNIEHLASRWKDDAKLDKAATVITDLKLDVWGLSEVSPNAVRALVQRLKQRFGEDYGYALSEPDAGDGKQSTAVIWRQATLRGERSDWPLDVAPLFHMDSRDPEAPAVENVHGKIFDRYPGLFTFSTVRRDPAFSFRLVPLHLKAMSEGSLRRRMASAILKRALTSLMSQGHTDIVVGGDLNAPVSSGDFDAFADAGFIPLGAEDEEAGSFTYLKGPQSLIDNIYLAPNLARTFGAEEFLIVARDRVLGDFVQAISDHRPVMVRMSLAKFAGARRVAAARSADIEEWLDRAQRESREHVRRDPGVAARGTPRRRPLRIA